jgi:hypothetical protein
MSLTQTATTIGLQLRIRKRQLPAVAELGAKMKEDASTAASRWVLGKGMPGEVPPAVKVPG